MVVLGIETSCDETAAAIWDDAKGLRANVIASQEEHGLFSGVVPELASRAHIRLLLPVIQRALTEAEMPLEEVEGVAVTRGPGLVGSLLVGLSVAKSMAFSLCRPLIGVHHVEGHMFAGLLEHPDLVPPFVALVVSGGHTELIFVPELGTYERLGGTRDDAAGEAFDKAAKMLGIGYPGGPRMDRLAREGDPTAVVFPRAYLDKERFEFSFSGLKTALLTYLESMSPEAVQERLCDIAAGFQQAIVDVLSDKLMWAVQRKQVRTMLVVGGVAANSGLRREMYERAEAMKMRIVFPSPVFCTDNAAMIARAGAFRLGRGESSGLDVNAEPRLKLVGS